MKKQKFPFPTKKLKNNKDISEHVAGLIHNAMPWLMLDGYRLFVMTPDEKGFIESKDASMCVTIKFPYRVIIVSVQQCTVDDCLSSEPSAHYWENLEHSAFHEAVHVILWRLVEIARRRTITEQELDDEEEFVTDHLANIIHQCVKDSRKPRKK